MSGGDGWVPRWFESARSDRRGQLFPLLVVALVAVLVGVAMALMALRGGSPGSGGDVPPAVITPSPSATPSAPTSSDTPTPSTSDTPTGTPSQTPDAGEEPVEPEVVEWGLDGTQLAIVVRNQSEVTIRQARVLITVLDSQDRALIATAGIAGSKCCTVLGLEPNQDFGLYLDLGPNGQQIAEEADQVLVRYLDLQTAPAGSSGRIEVGRARLRHTPDDTVVTAKVTARGETGPYVAGQAFLTDSEGRLVAVISGRFYCFGPGVSGNLRMHLQRPTPPGTKVQAVRAHPVPPGVTAGSEPGSCR